MTAAPTAEAVWEQYERLERSRVFVRSPRLLKLLGFLIRETLEGRSSELKESIIGRALYSGDVEYDPRIDSTVRVEARRLRRKLAAYYEAEGSADPIHISLPTGGYGPIFASSPPPAPATVSAASPSQAGEIIFERGPGAGLAIMPFRALSRDPDDAIFADGLTDELIYALERSRGLRVTSRNLTLLYKDRPCAPSTVASELGVDAVLHGTIRRDDTLVRITYEVSDRAGFIMWSDRFDAPFQDPLRLQERIATTILSRVRLDSSQMRAMQISPGGQALAAFAKVYRARRQLDQQTPQDVLDAAKLFAEVGDSAADYARGHAGVADAHCDLYRLGVITRPEALAVAKPAALRALEIDDQSSEGLTALATIEAWLERDAARAEATFQRALALGDTARAARIYGVMLTFGERHDEAASLFRLARAIEPFSVQQDIAEALSDFESRRFGSLVERSHATAGRGMPVEAVVFIALGQISGGHPDMARAALRDLEHTTIKHPDFRFARAEIEAWLGERERGRQILNNPGTDASSFACATLAAAIGDDERGLDALETAVSRWELSAVWLRTDARFDAWRRTARFQRVVEQLNAQRRSAVPSSDPNRNGVAHR